LRHAPRVCVSREDTIVDGEPGAACPSRLLLGGDANHDEDPAPGAGDGDEDPDPEPKPKPAKDAGTGDSSTPTKDAGPTGPAAFTKAEVQTLVDDRCSPCHTDFASGGMSLAPDFTTNTVGVASTQVPTMKRILKGDHTKSYLWHKVNGSHATVGGTGVRMPKSGTAFTATELDRLAKYIDSL
jgi:hypothetical protein